MNAATAIQKPVDKEQVRMLVADIGYQEAARRTGIAANTLYQWARRFQWNTPIPSGQRSVRLVRSPSTAHAEALAEYKARSTTALAKYSAEAAEEASSSKSKLNISRKAKDVADIHKTIWPQEQNQQNILNLAVLVNPPVRDGTETLEDGQERAIEGKVVSGEPEQS